MRLAVRLRSLRAAAGMPAQLAASALAASLTKVSRLESGEATARPADVTVLLDLYQVSGEDRGALLGLARQAAEAGWWDSYPRLPARVRHHLSVEAAADMIEAYDPQAVPALLQTAEYASAAAGSRAGWRAGLAIPALARRRELMSAPGRPQLWVLLSAAVLGRSPAPDPGVIRGQLQYLLACARVPGVTIQLIPPGTAAELSAAGPFSLLRSDHPELPDTVLLEQRTGTMMMEEPRDVDSYREVFLMVAERAQSPQDTERELAAAGGPR